MNDFEKNLYKISTLMFIAYVIWTLCTYNLSSDKKEILINGFICINLCILLFSASKLKVLKNYLIELDTPDLDINFYEESKGINKWQTLIIVLTLFEIMNILLFIHETFCSRLILMVIVCINMFMLVHLAKTLCNITIKAIELEDF